MIDPPEIVSLNNTMYYYTLNESVYIAVSGYYLAASGSIFAMIDN